MVPCARPNISSQQQRIRARWLYYYVFESLPPPPKEHRTPSSQIRVADVPLSRTVESLSLRGQMSDFCRSSLISALSPPDQDIGEIEATLGSILGQKGLMHVTRQISNSRKSFRANIWVRSLGISGRECLSSGDAAQDGPRI